MMTQTTARTVPELDPGKIRFAVGTSDGPRSAWWYVHMEPRANVYVGVRSLGEHLKLSLHGDRNCQFGMPRSRLDAMRKAGLPVPKNHYFFRWPRPVTPQKGAIQIVSIIIPTNLLNNKPPPDQSTKRRLPLFSPAPAGHALELNILYSFEPASSLEERLLHKCCPMIHNQLDNGEIIHFVGRVIPFDAPAFAARNWGNPSPLSGEIGQLQPGASLMGLTAIGWNDPHAEGRIEFLEASNAMLSMAAGSS